MKKLILILLVTLIFCLWADDLTIYQNTNRKYLAMIHAQEEVNLEKGDNLIKLENLTKSPIRNSFLIEKNSAGVELIYLDSNIWNGYAASIYATAKGKEVIVYLEDKEPLRGVLQAVHGRDIIVKEHDSGDIHFFTSDNVIDFVVPNLSDSEDYYAHEIKLNLYSSRKQDHLLKYSYLTTGISWEAVYKAVWNEDKQQLDLLSEVMLINNSEKDFENSKIKLIAGDIDLSSDNIQGKYRGEQANIAALSIDSNWGGGLQQSSIAALKLYSLSRPVDLPDGLHRIFELYPPAKVKTKEYFFYQAAARNTALQQTITFENTKDNGFGNPLPQGNMRIYTPDKKDGVPQFIGNSSLEQTPVGRKVIITLGDAFDLKAETKIINTEYSKDKKISIQKDYQIKINNYGNETVEILIHHTSYDKLNKIRDENFEYTRLDENTIEISIELEKETEKILTFSQAR